MKWISKRIFVKGYIVISWCQRNITSIFYSSTRRESSSSPCFNWSIWLIKLNISSIEIKISFRISNTVWCRKRFTWSCIAIKPSIETNIIRNNSWCEIVFTSSSIKCYVIRTRWDRYICSILSTFSTRKSVCPPARSPSAILSKFSTSWNRKCNCFCLSDIICSSHNYIIFPRIKVTNQTNWLWTK